MKHVMTRKAEIILIGLIIIEIIDLTLPWLIPAGAMNVILLLGILALILCRLESFDYTLRKKIGGTYENYFRR